MSEDKNKTYWTLDLYIDLYDCNVDKFNSGDIKSFAQSLGELIDQGNEVVGVVTDFGEGEEEMEGFRIIHETFACLVTGHFIKHSKKAYINIHSCMPYKPTEAIELCGDFFETTKYACKKNLRD